MLLKIFLIQFGYLLNVLYLLSGTMQYSRFLKKRYIFLALAIWGISVVLQGNSYFLAGPALFFLLMTSFLSNFESSLASVALDYKDKIKRVNDDISKQNEILSVELRSENGFRSQLENIINNYMVAKETLSHLNKLDFCKKISDILLSFEGVRSVAIFDERILCSMPENKSDWFRSVFDDFHNTRDVSRTNPDILIFGITVADRREAYVFLESETGKQESIKKMLKSIIPVVSLGFRRVSLFEEYELKSRRDALTGLFNRRYFESRLKNELERAKRYKNQFGILMLDIDHFKEINDTFGHSTGDAVLKKISYIISTIKYPGAFAGRYGGEEFVVCLPLCDRIKMSVLAESLRKEISEASERDFSDDLKVSANSHNMVESTHTTLMVDTERRAELVEPLPQFENRGLAPPNVSITVSIGGAIFPDDGRDANDVISAADLSLYKAKESGRNRCVISESRNYEL